MAAVTTTVMGGGIGAFQAYQGYEQKKKAEKGLSEYKRNEVKNAFEDVQVSTMGSDLMREESGRTTASLVDASREGGLRGVFGGIPKIQEFNTEANQKAQVYLDDQVNKRQYAVAEDNIRIQGIKEMRDRENIAGLSSQIQAGKQDMWSGIMGVGKSVMYGADNIDFTGKKKLGSAREQRKSNQLSKITPVGFNYNQRLANPVSTPTLEDYNLGGYMDGYDKYKEKGN